MCIKMYSERHIILYIYDNKYLIDHTQ